MPLPSFRIVSPKVAAEVRLPSDHRSRLMTIQLVVLSLALSPGAPVSRSAAAPRHPILRMVQNSYGPMDSWHVEKELSVTAAAAQLKCMLGPKPELEPFEVADMVLAALQRGENDDIAALFEFVMPDGQLASEHESSAGAMSKFRWKIRKEPRWKNIARRPQAALLKMRSYAVQGSIMMNPDVMIYRIKAAPYFPDCPVRISPDEHSPRARAAPDCRELTVITSSTCARGRRRRARSSSSSNWCVSTQVRTRKRRKRWAIAQDAGWSTTLPPTTAAGR